VDENTRIKRLKLAFANHITKAAKRLGFCNISPYSFRHQVAANFKKAGIGASGVAQCMGQQSEHAQQHYGHPRQSRGAVQLSAISAATPVRAKVGGMARRPSLDQSLGGTS